MLDVLNFAFSSFWRWAGITIWLLVVTQAISKLFGLAVAAVRNHWE